MSNNLKDQLASISAQLNGLQEKHAQNRLDGETFAAEVKAITDKVDELAQTPALSAETLASELVAGPDIAGLAKQIEGLRESIAHEADLRTEREQLREQDFASLKEILRSMADALDRLNVPVTGDGAAAKNAEGASAADPAEPKEKGKSKAA